MDPEHIPILLNMGISGVVLFLHLRQLETVKALQEELTEVRRAQWELLCSLFGEEHSLSMISKPKM